MTEKRMTRVYVDPGFAKKLKIMAAETDRSIISLTKLLKVEKPFIPKKKARWMTL